MKYKKLNSADKVFIVVLINFLVVILYNLYIKDCEKVIFALFCASIPVFLFLYYKFKLRNNVEKFKESYEISKKSSAEARFKGLLKQIPGFRTGEKSNMIIASIYYIGCLIFGVIAAMLGESKGVYLGVMSLFMPYMIFNCLNCIDNK